MRRFLVLVRSAPDLELFELHLLGHGVTQATSHQEFDGQLRDLVELLHPAGADAAATADFEYLYADRC